MHILNNTEHVKKLQKQLSPILIPISYIYQGAVYLKNILYDKSVKTPEHFDKIKIISVGNIAVGGVGKTPVVIEIANRLKKYGSVCIITNAYTAEDKSTNIVAFNGHIFKKPPSIADETYLIAKKTYVNVISSKDRRRAILLSRDMKSDYVILDDGLQKRNISRDYDICVVDKQSIYEDGHYLPAGFLRDSKASINRCDFLICVDKKGIANKAFECNEAKVVVKGIFGGQSENSRKKSAFLFCGIGKPLGFLKSVKDLGIDVKGYRFFDDHHIYSDSEIDALKKEKEKCGADLLLTTYKDFVKLNTDGICYLDISLEIENIDKIIDRIR